MGKDENPLSEKCKYCDKLALVCPVVRLLVACQTLHHAYDLRESIGIQCQVLVTDLLFLW